MRVKKANVYNSKFLMPGDTISKSCFAVVLDVDSMPGTKEGIDEYKFRIAQKITDCLEGLKLKIV